MVSSLSFRQLFSLALVLVLGLLAATILEAWTGPTAPAPGGNVAAPLNVGTTDQVKDAGISLNSLAVFGSQYIQDKLGVGRTSPIVALDVNGSIKFGNGGELCQAVSEGAQRYNNTSKKMEFCNGTAWVTGGGGAPSKIVTFTSGTNQTYTPSAGVTAIMVEVWGGGGGYGGNGGDTSFGSVISATGGEGSLGSSGRGGQGGMGTGGDLNLKGAGGNPGDYITNGSGGAGGSAPRGGGGGYGGGAGGGAGGAGGSFGGGGGGYGGSNNGGSSGGGAGGYAMKK